jgi:hypothetical protein
MGILGIEQAAKKRARLLIEFYGGPQSGKTKTALLLARGLVGPTGRIIGICSEAGRMNLYADEIPGGFLVGQLNPPHTPARYIQAIDEAVDAGADAIVIDTLSHAWSGMGGYLDMVNASTAKGQGKHAEAKAQFAKLVNKITTQGAHIILCARGKTPLKETRVDGKTVYVEGDPLPIQDKKLRFEMTLVFPMIGDGHYRTELRTQDGAELFKAPGEIRNLFDGTPMGIEHGRKIAEWLGGVRQVDTGLEKIIRAANMAASEGTEAFKAWQEAFVANWKTMPPEHKDAYRERLEDWKSAAAATDAEKARLAAELAKAEADEPTPDQRPWRTEALSIMTKAGELKPNTPEAELFARSRGTQDFLSAYAAFVAAGNPDHEQSLKAAQDAVAALTAKS